MAAVTAALVLLGLGLLGAFLLPRSGAQGKAGTTYAGLSLYRYSGDRRPGDANGQGIGGVWFAVGPAGRIVKG